MFKKHVIKTTVGVLQRRACADQSQRVREHLLACKRCRKEHDEIKLGVNLAQQLPLASAPAEIWSEIEALLDEPSRRPVFEPKARGLSSRSTWYRVAAVSAVLLAAVVIGLIVSSRSIYNVPRASLEVDSVGAVRIGGDTVGNKGSWRLARPSRPATSPRRRLL